MGRFPRASAAAPDNCDDESLPELNGSSSESELDEISDSEWLVCDAVETDGEVPISVGLRVDGVSGDSGIASIFTLFGPGNDVLPLSE